MTDTTTTETSTSPGPVTPEQALEILGPGRYRDGGGWGRLNGREVYLCTGAHRDGTAGWAITQVGRDF